MSIQSEGLTRSEYRVKYQLLDSAFTYHLQKGRIGFAYVPEGSGVKANVNGKSRKQLRGSRYVDRAPISDLEAKDLPKYTPDGVLLEEGSVLSVFDLVEATGISLVSRIGIKLQKFAEETDYPIVRYSYFEKTFESSALLIGLEKSYEGAFLNWLESQSSKKPTLSRKNRAREVSTYVKVTPEHLATFYPYNAVEDVFKGLGRMEDLYRVSPVKLCAYLESPAEKQMKEDLESIFLKGIPVPTYAKTVGITKTAMYYRLERYREQLTRDRSLYMFGD